MMKKQVHHKTTL